MGLNARKRKEKKLIERYGEVPQPKRFPWLKVIGAIIALAVIGWLGTWGYKKASPKVSDWYASYNAKRTATPQPGTTSSPTKQSDSKQEEKTVTATIKTTKGDIEIELFKKDAPKTVENFEKLAEKGYYDGIIFHRVIQDFMIQTGDPTGTGTGGESAFGKDFADEDNDYKMEPGMVAMANRGPNTNGSQFFIVTEKRQAHLEGRHTIFGKVTNGMDVVKAIAAVDVDSNDKPLQDVKMEKVTVTRK